MFNPKIIKVTDTEWILSKYTYNRLRKSSNDQHRSMGWMARTTCNNFVKLCREVDYDLSKLSFQMMDFEPRSVTVSININFRKNELEKVCMAGRFGPEMMLEVALSCQGKRV